MSAFPSPGPLADKRDAPSTRQAPTEFRPCVLIPTYNNARTIRRVVDRVRAHTPHVIVIDDGSAGEGRTEVAAIGREGLAHVFHREINGGKGAAVKTGFDAAHALGFSHALQVDADGQHALDDIPAFLATASQHPDSVVLGYPVFDESVPHSRLIGRKITIFWTLIETFGQVIRDPMCGFRVYPLASCRGVATGTRMEFDIEIAVRLVWKGVGVVNVPTRVRYPSAAEGGVSHFRLFRDNLAITWLHTRLVFEAILGLPRRATRGLLR